MDTEWTRKNFTSPYIERGKNEMNKTETYDYPKISDKLIECLERDFPDKLPRKYQDSYELGILTGQQTVIDKLKYEKSLNEKDVLN